MYNVHPPLPLKICVLADEQMTQKDVKINVKAYNKLLYSGNFLTRVLLYFQLLKSVQQ
jgi:hypothetical protein